MILLNACIYILFTTACTQKAESDQGVVLDEKQMAEILADAHLTESINKIEGDRFQLQFDLDHAYDIVFEHHGTTFEEFDASLSYYQDHPEKLEAIYDEVIIILSEMQAQNATRKSTEQADSAQ